MIMEENILELSEVGNLIDVENLLKEGFNPNFQNSEGETALQIAAANGHTKLVTLLLNYGAVIDLSNNYGWTPLMHASKYGHFSTIAHLLKMKAKVNLTNKLGISAIIAAVCSGSLESVKLLVEAGAMIDHMSTGSETSECDLSAVMAASLYGYDSILQYLLKFGVKINHSSSVTGLTPLMLAACGGHKHIITRLIEIGVDSNQKDICGRTALDYALLFNQFDAKICLENFSASDYRGSISAYDSFEKIKIGEYFEVKAILEKDKDFVKYAEPNSGITALMTAAIHGQSDIASLLISFGAPLNSQDTQNGWTALMHSVRHKHPEIVRLLLEKGADTDVCASNGYTVLDLATHIEEFDPAIIEMLVSKPISIGAKSSLQTNEAKSRERLSVDERLPTKRSLSQTRVKEWIGGVAQQLQNKMLTLRSPKFSENVPSIEISVTDESSNEVFLEQTVPPQKLDRDNLNDPVMLPPDLYLANALKEQIVEAIIPPFPAISMDAAFCTNEVQKKSPRDKNSTPCVNSLRVPNLLKNHRKKCLKVFKARDIEKTSSLSKSQLSKEKKVDSNLPEDNGNLNNSYSSNKQEFTSTENSSSSCRPVQGDLTILLNKESLQKYTETFRSQEVDVETFLHLTESDLKEIGIENTESQKKLLEVIKKLNESE